VLENSPRDFWTFGASVIKYFSDQMSDSDRTRPGFARNCDRRPLNPRGIFRECVLRFHVAPETINEIFLHNTFAAPSVSPLVSVDHLATKRALPVLFILKHFLASVPAPKSLGLRWVQNGPPARHEEGAYLKGYGKNLPHLQPVLLFKDSSGVDICAVIVGPSTRVGRLISQKKL
jgi:hypothetical protein